MAGKSCNGWTSTILTRPINEFVKMNHLLSTGTAHHLGQKVVDARKLEHVNECEDAANLASE